MLTRMRLVKGATALLYIGPLIAGLCGLGWDMVAPFAAIFVVWLMVLRPEQWPTTPGEWLTGQAWLAALAQVLSQVLLVGVLLGIGRGQPVLDIERERIVRRDQRRGDRGEHDRPDDAGDLQTGVRAGNVDAQFA